MLSHSDLYQMAISSLEAQEKRNEELAAEVSEANAKLAAYRNITPVLTSLLGLTGVKSAGVDLDTLIVTQPAKAASLIRQAILEQGDAYSSGKGVDGGRQQLANISTPRWRL